MSSRLGELYEHNFLQCYQSERVRNGLNRSGERISSSALRIRFQLSLHAEVKDERKRERERERNRRNPDLQS